MIKLYVFSFIHLLVMFEGLSGDVGVLEYRSNGVIKKSNTPALQDSITPDYLKQWAFFSRYRPNSLINSENQ